MLLYPRLRSLRFSRKLVIWVNILVVIDSEAYNNNLLCINDLHNRMFADSILGCSTLASVVFCLCDHMIQFWSMYSHPSIAAKISCFGS